MTLPESRLRAALTITSGGRAMRSRYIRLASRRLTVPAGALLQRHSLPSSPRTASMDGVSSVIFMRA